ncbi:hypothetical protein Dsin_011849 [Dipteronia sinensis]|uniref:Uncharacterized protein n=1 Tax=Dipteronia sinensis TaxID=43782 RepID=A0AAE0AI92_9ROSI|nr:hypothetical protein Dsin_011849 [Dipteronia sinensis]
MAAEAIVSTVLEQLTSILSREVLEEVSLVVGVKKEIKKLTSNFRAIQAVLVDAEQRQVKEAAVGVWLDMLKDASYDMDDVLDEWNTAILKLQIEGVENAPIPKKKVCFMFSSRCICFRHVALRHDIGVKIKEINENLDSIAIEKDKYNLNAIRSIEEPQRLKTTSFIKVSEIRGRNEEKNNIVYKLLIESNVERTNLPVISIVGLGGIGKTTLAQLAFNDAKIVSKFDHRVWVCVSEPFDEDRIARAIIEGLTGQATILVEFQSLLECISETIVNKKFLLILDDVWTENDVKWTPLYDSLNDGLHGESRILVTTRKEKVARMMKSIDGIDIGVLSSYDSWLLFKQFAFCDRSQEECEKLENIGREIVDKCKGLPLAIKTIGSLLRFKKSRDQWQRILDSEIWKLKELEGLFPPLLLSYNDLPSMVKRCFSYCAIFPKDFKMEKDELIKLWMAQGYFGLKRNEELEIIGEECFDTLAMHSFFQEFEKDEDGNIDGCKLHDIVHDFAQFLVKNECFSKEIYDGEKANLDVYREKARHSMLIMKSSYNVNISSVQKLRSLLIEGGHISGSLSSFSPDLFEQLTCLRSLKLSGSWDNKIPSEIGKLIHLRYLNISKLNITELPETLCCLYNLQSLNISRCECLEVLPQGMGKLINLRHLINWGTDKVKYMPKGIEKLVCLRRLDRFVVKGGPIGMGLGCLIYMNELRGELKLEGLGEVVDEAEAKNAQLMKKTNLVHLQLWFGDGSEISSVEECNKDSAVLEALKPPTNLERLLIGGCRSISLSPHWMVSLIQLKGLDLRNCRNLGKFPANLGKLPRLEDLSISEMKSVKRVGNEFVGIETSSSSFSPSLIAFPKLKRLRIESMENWEEWEYMITAGDVTIMPSLSHLSIVDCLKLKSLPDYLLHSTSLEKLTINDCEFKYLPALGKLPRLKYLEITNVESVTRVGNEFVGIETSSSSSPSPSLIAFPKLKTLEISWMEYWEEWEYKITAEDITIMPSLSRLTIRFCPILKSLPDYLLHATTLEKLTIYNCKFEYLPALGKLPRLEYLMIGEMKSVKRVGNEFVGIEISSSSSSPSLIAFPKLKTLIFSSMKYWEEWEYKITAGDNTIMPSLSDLSIRYCPKLKSLPDHILHATTLKKLIIGDECLDLEECYRVERGENWPKISKY